MDSLNDLLDNARVGELPLVSTVTFLARDWDSKLTVEMSPSWSSSPARIFLKILRMILPLRVFGRSGTMKICFGAAKGPILFRTCRMSDFLKSSDGSLPSLIATNAATAWPVSSSLMPTTAASATALCSMSAASISAVERRWPLTLTTSSTRPRIQ